MTRKHKPAPDRAEVLRLIAIKGEFHVHKFRTKERTIRERCRKMELDGLIVIHQNWSDELVYTTLEIAQKIKASHTSASSKETDHADQQPC